MTSSAASIGASPLTVLYQVAQTEASLTQQMQLAQISQDLQNQLNRQLAGIETPVDQVSVDYSQAQIKALTTQQKTVSKFATLFGNNGMLLADMTNQLNLMTQAINNSDGAAFDAALTALNTDLGDLTPPGFNPLFQTDGSATLKSNGFNIQSSASYNLSTASGQAAATTDVTAAQNQVESILNVNGANHTVAASEVTALNGRIAALQSLQTQQQNAEDQTRTQEVQRLQKNMQNQLHLIELNLGKAGQLATMLNQFANPPQRITSAFGALENAVGENGATAETQLGQTPAILSLFA